MTDVLGYGGRRVVVTGCASGMGHATAALLGELGAEVHGLDVRAGDAPLAAFHAADLRDPAAIDRAADAIGDGIDALFNCAGLGPTHTTMDMMRVNFIGTRHLTERLLPGMASGGAVASVASTAAMGWSRRVPVHKALIAIDDYAGQVAWAEANAVEVGEGYSFSKEAVVVWTMLRAQQLIGRGIRINAVLPGLTQTPMLTGQIAVNTAAAVLDEVIRPIGRPARPEEQAFFLAVANSPRASYLNGAAINVDGGRFARLAMAPEAPAVAPMRAGS